MVGSADAPATTGSIGSAVQVQKPVPETLAYSDATKIGQAAAAALWQANSEADTEWTNAATGSSGTVQGQAPEALAANQPDLTGTCRSFRTLVTSIGGVHSYSGKVCKAGDGRPVVQYAP